MNVRRRGRLAAGIALAAMLAFSGCTATTAGNGGMGDGMDHDGRGTDRPDASVDWNHADVMFAQMMIPHHEQAIEMSDLILEKDGVDPEVVELAEEIKAAQGPEIEQMESWLDEWGVPTMMDDDDMGDMGDMGGMGGMGGMLTDEEMDELEAADGSTGTTRFLEGMIEHHEGAIDMAEWHQDHGEDDDALELTASIIKSQTAEIVRMRQLLAG